MESTGYLRVLRRHLALVFGVALIGLVASSVAVILITPTYHATATLFLKVNAASTSLYERSQFALQRIQSYPQLLDSPALLKTVKTNLGLPQSTQQLAAQISGTNPTNTVLLQVTADASTPDQAAAIANAAAQALASNVNALENTQTTSKNAVTLNQEITAQAPLAPSSPNRPVILGLGLLAGLIVGYILALLSESLRPRLRTAEDVRRVLGLPLVAQLPRNETHGRRPVRSSEATDTMASNLAVLGNGAVPPVVLLAPSDRASARPAVRYLVATALAQTGRRIAVLETEPDGPFPGGVEIPATAARLDLSAPAGQTPHVLTAAAPGGVDVVLAEAPAGTSRVTLEKAFGPSLHAVASGYDTTVLQAELDGSSVPLHAAAPAARGAFIVVSRSRTSQHAARRVLTHLRLLGVVPVGVLMVDAAGSHLPDLLETWRDDDLVVITAEGAGGVESYVSSPSVAAHDTGRPAEHVRA